MLVLLGTTRPMPSRGATLKLPPSKACSYLAARTTDLIVCVVADPLGRELDQPVVVENKGGGGGAIGAVFKTAPLRSRRLATTWAWPLSPPTGHQPGHQPLRSLLQRVHGFHARREHRHAFQRHCRQPQFAGGGDYSIPAEVKKNPR